MKNVEFSTSKGEYYLVDFPDASSFAGVVNGTIFYYRGPQNSENYAYPLALKKKVEWIGDPRELTAEECEKIIDEVWDDFHYGSGEGYYWIYPYNEDNEVVTESAKSSFLSLLKMYGVLIENPLGEKPEPDYKVLWGQEGGDAVQAWKEAQEKVYKNPMMFKIKE